MELLIAIGFIPVGFGIVLSGCYCGIQIYEYFSQEKIDFKKIF